MSLVSRLQYLVLAGFLLSLFQLSVTALFFNYALLALDLKPSLRGRLRRNRAFQSRNILITGIENPAGLHLARSLSCTGHNVTTAAYRPGLLPLHVRFSAVLWRRFYRLEHAIADDSAPGFIKEILDIVQDEDIDLWIDCSQPRLNSLLRRARGVVEKRSRCLAFLPSDKHADILASSDSFLSYLHSQGLPSLDSYQVGSRAEIHDVLNTSRGKKRYKLWGPDGAGAKSVLPRRTMSQTYHEVSQVMVQKSSPWQLKQHIEGKERYTTSSVIVKGQLRAFAASPLSGPHYIHTLPPRSATHKALRKYVEALSRSLGNDFTGHLAIDFVTDETPSITGVEKLHFPVAARLEPGDSLLLFQGVQGHLALSRAYLAAVTPGVNGITSSAILNGYDDHDGDNDSDDDQDDDNSINGINYTHETEALIQAGDGRGVYSLGYDISELAISPIKKLLRFKIGVLDLVSAFSTLAKHILGGQECVYDFKDPLPFWWLYQVYLPLTLVRLALELRSARNTSTGTSSRQQALRTYIGWH